MANQFVYLYPIKEYLEFEVETHFHSLNPKDKKPFKDIYFGTLNRAIDIRYRQKGFGINWVLFNNREPHPRVYVKKKDRLVRCGISFEEHTILSKYPSNEHILGQIPSPDSKCIITGFHMWDCVEKLAHAAHDSGLTTLVDEDLTEFLPGRILSNSDFNLSRFPSLNPRANGSRFFEYFMKARRGKPWLWQDY